MFDERDFVTGGVPLLLLLERLRILPAFVAVRCSDGTNASWFAVPFAELTCFALRDKHRNLNLF